MVSESVYLILHWITLGITLSFGLGFLYFHIPPAEGLRPYRLCRYAMACAYLSLSVIDLFGPLLRTEANSLYLMQYVTLVISSLHAFLFTFTLVTLIDPLFLTWRRVAYELLPVVLLISLSGAMLFYEIPALFVVVSWCFTGYYICQLIRYLYLFFRHYKACTSRLDNFFTEQESRRLQWVKTGFILALLIGILSLVNVFYVNPLLTNVFQAVHPLFYIWFGICLINYVHVYHEIAPALDDISTEASPESGAVAYFTMLETSIHEWINQKGFTESKITIARLASCVGSNRTYLSRYLNIHQQKSFSAWINELRIEEAKRLMQTYPEKSLGEVSLLTGYSDKSNFSRQFKKLTGQGAKSWREKMPER